MTTRSHHDPQSTAREIETEKELNWANDSLVRTVSTAENELAENIHELRVKRFDASTQVLCVNKKVCWNTLDKRYSELSRAQWI